jgi:uncharacterized protein
MKTLMRNMGPAAICALALAGAAAPAAMAQTIPAPATADALFRATTLNLSAYGEARVAPDKAMITLGVMTEAPTASAAMEQNRARMSEVIAALKRAGIAERDIQTTGLNLNPQYVYRENEPPRLSGYQASNQVTITVNDLNRLGAAIDATVSAGANQVQGISFGLKDPAAAETQARLDAVKALQAKAALYAQATGHRVNQLVSLSEGGGYSAPPPMPVMAMARAEKFDASTPVQPGQLTVRIDVTGLYELAR